MKSVENEHPVRVLMIRNAQPYDFGGGERIPVHLAQEFIKHGIEPIVVSRAPKVLAYAASKNIPTIRGWWWSHQNWSGPYNALLPVYIGWQLILIGWYCALICRTKADIIHPQSKDDFIAATVAGRLLGKPVIWSDYADLKYIYMNHRVWYKNPIGKLIYSLGNQVRAVILTSLNDKRLIEESLGGTHLPKQYQVIYYGVPSQKIVPAKRQAKDANTFIYCATSRLVTAKGIGELIRAFKRLNAVHADSRLWLIGDGPDAKTFQKLAGGHPAITFFGHKEQPLELVAASDVFVHPSYLEGFSISLIEAAMLEKPIIACDVGGNPEIIIDHQTGLLIKDRDDDSLYDAMETLYNNRPFAMALAKHARKHFMDNLQFEDIVTRQIIPLYTAK